MHARYREIFAALKSEIIDLHLRWIIYRQLYAASPEDIDLLNKSGSNVFFLLQHLLLDDCALRLSKLTDPADQGRFANLSVLQLLENIAETDKNFPRAEIEALIEELRTRTEKFRKLRNKRIAHADLEHALKVAEDPLPGISRADIEQALDALRRVMNKVELHYDNSQTLYEETIVAHEADGNKLLSVLEKGHDVRR
jgi:hypothetical protein